MARSGTFWGISQRWFAWKLRPWLVLIVFVWYAHFYGVHVPYASSLTTLLFRRLCMFRNLKAWLSSVVVLCLLPTLCHSVQHWLSCLGKEHELLNSTVLFGHVAIFAPRRIPEDSHLEGYLRIPVIAMVHRNTRCIQRKTRLS